MPPLLVRAVSSLDVCLGFVQLPAHLYAAEVLGLGAPVAQCLPAAPGHGVPALVGRMSTYRILRGTGQFH